MCTETAEFRDQFVNELRDHCAEINYNKFQKHVEDTLGNMYQVRCQAPQGQGVSHG